MLLGKLDSYIQKIKLGHFLTPCVKLESKQIKDLNLRTETITRRKKTWVVNFDISINSTFFLSVSSGKGIKSKNKKLDNIKLRCICTVKEIINKIKSPSIEWEKVFAMIYLIKG